jgi:hypothetical protein
MASTSQAPAVADVSFEGIMAAFKELPMDQRMRIRRYAADSLISDGADEVGSSDVNHEIVKIYRRLKRWPVAAEESKRATSVVARLLGEDDSDPPGTIRTDTPDRNPLSDLADQVEGAAHRIAGLIPRRQNMNLSSDATKSVMAQLEQAYDILSNVAEVIDNDG